MTAGALMFRRALAMFNCSFGGTVLALWHPATASQETDIIYFSDAGWHQSEPRKSH